MLRKFLILDFLDECREIELSQTHSLNNPPIGSEFLLIKVFVEAILSQTWRCKLCAVRTFSFLNLLLIACNRGPFEGQRWLRGLLHVCKLGSFV